MKKGDVIQGYTVLKDFTTAGGGLSKWTFARKGGEEFFFKEFLSPTYPVDGGPGSSKTKARKLERCQAFESHQRSLMKAVSSKCTATGGNLIFARDFFRHGAKYYKVTEKVDIASLTKDEISHLPLESRVLIMKTVAHSVRILHQLDIVHGDLKPDNILIKRAGTGSYVAKLIDFDNSFFSGRPPELSEELVGDLVFYSPEFAGYASGSKTVRKGELQIRSDIFALGIIFCLYLTAELPEFDREKYQYPWKAANSGHSLRLPNKETFPVSLGTIVDRMLAPHFEARPTITEVFECLKKVTVESGDGIVKPTKSADRSAASVLKGTLTTKKATPSPEHTEAAEIVTEPRPTTSKLRGKLIK